MIENTLICIKSLLFNIINFDIYFSQIRQFRNFYLRKELRTLIINLGVFAKTNPQLDFNPKHIPKLESNAKLT